MKCFIFDIVKRTTQKSNFLKFQTQVSSKKQLYNNYVLLRDQN